MSHLAQSLSVCKDWLIRPYLVIWVCGRLIGLFVLSLVSQSFYLYPFPLCNFMPLSSEWVCVCVCVCDGLQLLCLLFLQCGNQTLIRTDCLARSELGNYMLYPWRTYTRTVCRLPDLVSKNLLKLLSCNGNVNDTCLVMVVKNPASSAANEVSIFESYFFFLLWIFFLFSLTVKWSDSKAQMRGTRVSVYSRTVNSTFAISCQEKQLCPAPCTPGTQRILQSAVHNHLINSWVCVWPKMQ